MKLIRIAVLVAVCFAAAPLFAGDMPADNMEIVREAIQAEKKLFIADNMQLTDSEAKAFWPIYESYQTGLRKLVDRNIALIERYAKTYPNEMSEQAANVLLRDHLDIEDDSVELRKTFLPRFGSAIPAPKVARYYQLENKIRAVANFDMAVEIPVIPVK